MKPPSILYIRDPTGVGVGSGLKAKFNGSNGSNALKILDKRICQTRD